MDEEGDALAFNGSSWSLPTPVENPAIDGVLMSVSCPSSSFCVAKDAAGDVLIGPGEWLWPTPAVTGLSPKTGPATGGTTVTITGTPFYGVTAVHFGPNEAIIKSHTETSLTVETPAGEGTVYVTVTTPGGTSPATGKEAKHAKFKYKKVKVKR